MKQTRNEILKECWIHISERLPPDCKEEIVCWNYQWQTYVLIEGWVARLTAKKILLSNNIEEEISPDRRISHWIPRVGP